MVLTRHQARAFYDHFGRRQDSQSFYEDAALDDLVAHAAFEQSAKTFELGCGTGRFASRLLTRHLSPSAEYLGIDLSTTMTKLAKQRVSGFAERAQVTQSDGSLHFALPDQSVDRVIATYVLDLLPEIDIRQVISEAHRVLLPNGKLCLVSLTHGATLASRMVCAIWSAIFSVYAPAVGGCRPIALQPFIDSGTWSIDHRAVVIRVGVPSEVLIASPRRS
jgi:ubiquinone/menaquinone biosynthesis C-methylase UbiE